MTENTENAQGYESDRLLDAFPQDIKDLLFENLISEKMQRHPLPWKTDRDWGWNILDSQEKEVFHCLREERVAKKIIEFVTVYKPVYDKEQEDLLREATGS